jgi:phytoene synthase
MESMDVTTAYDTCRRLQRRHDPTFYWATRWLPAERRSGVHALYGFFRGADEIVDGHGRAGTAEDRRRALEAWGRALEDGRRTGRSEHPVLAALVDAAPRHGIPLELAPRYLRSMGLDCDGSIRIESRDELDDYMEGSAATVGRLVAPVLGVPGERREAVARLGLAFQLTNFLRDVAEDWRLDRLYLPGVDPEAPRSPATRRAMAAEVQRARGLFASERDVVDAVPSRARPAVRLAGAVYRRYLDRIELRGFAVA